MADICNVGVLPEHVTTVQQALEHLSGLEFHAFATTRGKLRVIHARDLLRADHENKVSINQVKGMSLGRMPMKVTLNIKRNYGGFEGLGESLRHGKGDDAVYPVFEQIGTDFLLGAIEGDLAVLVSRHEGYAASVNVGACVCDGNPRHFCDNPPAGSGKQCEKAGCSGKYRCY